MKSSFLLAAIAGIGFIILAALENVHSWPLAFPFLAGIIAMMVNKSRETPRRYATVLRGGFYASVLVFIIMVPVIWFLDKEMVKQALKDAGINDSPNSLLYSAGVALSLSSAFFIAYLVGTALGTLFPPKKSNFTKIK